MNFNNIIEQFENNFKDNQFQFVDQLECKLYSIRTIKYAKSTEILCTKMMEFNHPNLSKIFGYVINQNQIFYLIQQNEMYNLQNQFQTLQLDKKIVMFYGIQILCALIYLHKRNIIFRNLQSQSIILMKNGYIKLSNYDLCRYIQKNQKTNTLCGTPDYMAPECILGKGYNQSVDIWSFGIILFELCTGELPFQANNALELYDKILNKQIIVNNFVDKDIGKLIKKLLTKKVSSRIKKIKSLENILQQFLLISQINLQTILQQQLEAPYYP